MAAVFDAHYRRLKTLGRPIVVVGDHRITETVNEVGLRISRREGTLRMTKPKSDSSGNSQPTYPDLRPGISLLNRPLCLKNSPRSARGTGCMLETQMHLFHSPCALRD